MSKYTPKLKNRIILSIDGIKCVVGCTDYTHAKNKVLYINQYPKRLLHKYGITSAELKPYFADKPRYLSTQQLLEAIEYWLDAPTYQYYVELFLGVVGSQILDLVESAENNSSARIIHPFVVREHVASRGLFCIQDIWNAARTYFKFNKPIASKTPEIWLSKNKAAVDDLHRHLAMRYLPIRTAEKSVNYAYYHPLVLVHYISWLNPRFHTDMLKVFLNHTETAVRGSRKVNRQETQPETQS